MTRPYARLAIISGAILAVLSCGDNTATRPIAPRAPSTNPSGSAALLPPSVRIGLPVDSVLTGDTLGNVTATAFDFSGKEQHQASISWATHGVGSTAGVVTIAGVNQKAQQVTLKGILRGRLMLVASYTDRWGQTARDSALFRVAPRTATVGICQIAKRVADSLGISGDTTMDWSIVGPFCLPDTATVIPPPTPGMDTTKALPTRLSLGMALLDRKVRVRVHVLRPEGARE